MSLTINQLEAQRRYRERHRERLRARSRAAYKANPDRAKANQKRHTSKPETKIKRAALSKQWRDSHPGYYREYWKKYRNAHRGEIRTRNQLRKRKIKSVFDGDIMVVVTLNKWQGQPSFVCHYCKQEFPTTLLHVDHKIPLSRGGRHCLENLAQACQSCNLKKNNKTEEEFCA